MGLVASTLCCCLQAASCACSMASCCLRSGGGMSGKAAKFWYVFMLGLASILAIIFRNYGDDMNIKLYAWTVGCTQGDEYCKGNAAVYRISFVLTIFFSIITLGTLCANRAMHCGLWLFKLIAFFALLIGTIFIDNNVFDNDGYAWLSRVASVLFLLLQILILIDFGYQWNTDWVNRAYADDPTEPSDKKWIYGIIASAVTLFVASLVGIILLFVYYDSCGLGQAFNSITLLSVLGMTLLSIFRDKIIGVEGAILPAAVVSSYCVYLNWSALNSNPDDTCKPANESNAGTITIGIIFAAISLMWTSYSTSQSTKALITGGGDQGGEESSQLNSPINIESGGALGHDDEEEDAAGSDEQVEPYWIFHLIMVAASLYMAMLLTNWGSDEDPHGNSSGPDKSYGAASMWVKIVSEWLTILLYVWTLVAPKILQDRDF